MVACLEGPNVGWVFECIATALLSLDDERERRVTMDGDGDDDVVVAIAVDDVEKLDMPLEHLMINGIGP